MNVARLPPRLLFHPFVTYAVSDLGTTMETYRALSTGARISSGLAVQGETVETGRPTGARLATPHQPRQLAHSVNRPSTRFTARATFPHTGGGDDSVPCQRFRPIRLVEQPQRPAPFCPTHPSCDIPEHWPRRACTSSSQRFDVPACLATSDERVMTWRMACWIDPHPARARLEHAAHLRCSTRSSRACADDSSTSCFPPDRPNAAMTRTAARTMFQTVVSSCCPIE